ncbi:MAG: TSUP family transporter, partial [Spirochaetales bacterium]|nr:TSUP family transporter [Spirochaetales bacterium]
MVKLLVLCPLVFLAGFIDSIAGGGGLISLNSYQAMGIRDQYALGTNKFSSFVGCTVASINYIRTGNVHVTSLVPSVICALIGSFLGSRVALGLSSAAFNLIMLVATPVVALTVFFKRDYSSRTERRKSPAAYIVLGSLIGLAVGFYDGFYGPGAGMFMQFGFIMIVGLEVRKACGNARIVNWASNLGALVNFIVHGFVAYEVAVACALFSVLGNFIGSRLAIKKDIRIVRPVMLVVTGLLFVKLVLDYAGIT